MPGRYTDLSEHTNTLISLLGLFATIAGLLFWRMFSRVEKKLDGWLEVHEACRVRQENERREVLDRVESGLKNLQIKRETEWHDYFWPHIHDEAGDVKIPKVVKVK